MGIRLWAMMGVASILGAAACKTETGGGGGAGGASCDSASRCATALDDGSAPCAGMGASQYAALQACAASSCAAACKDRFGQQSGLGETCLDCLTMSCTTTLQACDDH